LLRVYISPQSKGYIVDFLIAIVVFSSSTSSRHLKYLDFFRREVHGTWQMYNGTHIHSVTDLSSQLPARNCAHVLSSYPHSYICDHPVLYGTFFSSARLLSPTFSSRIAVLSRTSIGTRQNATLLQALELIHGSMLGT